MKSHLFVSASASGSSVECSRIVFNGESVRYTLGDNLLSTLLEQGVKVPYGCRAGVCRACEVFNETTQETLLCCQTQIIQPLTLRSYVPMATVSMKINRIERFSDYAFQVEISGPIDHVFGLPVDLHCSEQKKIRVYVESDALEPLIFAINPLLSPMHQLFLDSIQEGDTIKVNVAKSANVRTVSRFQQLTLDRFALGLILVNQSQISLNTWQDYFMKESIKDVSSVIVDDVAGGELIKVKKWLSAQSTKQGFSRGQWIIQGSQLSPNVWNQIIIDFQLNPNKVTFFL
ncbi:2Fe-2S iron-sulfur cluster binding domain-containing protein [Marinomonas sp. 15G1-11]|uniref:2Fe-2S iron-sulfur cluster binding domain-containing protein n=1 Tax=Marinomonas phaeophyticola TaxID=3004091 RepID=A0ABT4K091_9GAMM|nr:2Fe-2S iron-sulfur cluster binding domain-containing protein [Marinomonas sp. 15G1-11]MCZ2723438.1 2Fe-2S iron-sulfur cluster binding domain-containing protein [Marinomonas sp. 15G1-11]